MKIINVFGVLLTESVRIVKFLLLIYLHIEILLFLYYDKKRGGAYQRELIG